MTKSISVQKRQDVVSILNRGLSYTSIAPQLSISKEVNSEIKNQESPHLPYPLSGRPRILSASMERVQKSG